MTAQTLQATEAATPKIQYRVTNWPEYDRALVERGSLTIWFDEEFLQSHWRPVPTGKRGAPFCYSDQAIQALLGLKAVFDLPYRMVEGLAGSIVQLLGLALPIPDHLRCRGGPDAAGSDRHAGRGPSRSTWWWIRPG